MFLKILVENFILFFKKGTACGYRTQYVVKISPDFTRLKLPLLKPLFNPQNTKSIEIKKRIDNKNMDITYKIKFIDIFRFMATSLSKLVDNLKYNIHNDKCIKCKSNLCFVRAIMKHYYLNVLIVKRNMKKKLINN